MILSGHDISDGGLITTLCEMSISSGIGIDIDVDIKNNDNLQNNKDDNSLLKYFEFFFNEELGIVIEIESAFIENW